MSNPTRPHDFLLKTDLCRHCGVARNSVLDSVDSAECSGEWRPPPSWWFENVDAQRAIYLMRERGEL